MGTGCARGFLAAFDTAWMVRGWAQGKSPLELLAERYRFILKVPHKEPIRRLNDLIYGLDNGLNIRL